jgi:hypothetical protein
MTCRYEKVTNKKAHPDSRVGFLSKRGLNRYDVLCLGTFLALGDSKLNFLTFGQCLEART